MNKGLQITLIVLAVLVGVVVFVGAGFFFGRASWGWGNFVHGGMMGQYFDGGEYPRTGYGMMGGRGFDRSNYGSMPFNGGMMGGYNTAGSADPLSVDESLDAVEAYLADLGNDDLEVEEIMVFEYNSYAIVKESSTGVGAFELLIDPETQAVYPEYGPNMMWNLKYGMHAGNNFGPGMMGGGMMGGGMMGGYGYDFADTPDDVSAELTVSEAEALELAQDYLDAHDPGVTVSDEITAFYGYYTIDLEEDGALVGMLSVNGFSGQVFPHTWHGDFIEMAEFGHE